MTAHHLPVSFRQRLRRWSSLGLLLAMLFVLFAGGRLGRALAADEGVYGPTAPEGSAFVRLFNASNVPLSGGRIGEESFDEVAGTSASEFVFLPPGSQTLSVGADSQAITLAPNRYYTVVRTGTGFTVLDNGRHQSRLKALVLFYNFTEAPALSLRTPDGKAAVVDAVAAKAYGSREVNAVKASLAVFSGTEKIADAKPVGMERGRAYSLFATGSATAPTLTWIVN